jgi:hypothetical protein
VVPTSRVARMAARIRSMMGSSAGRRVTRLASPLSRALAGRGATSSLTEIERIHPLIVVADSGGRSIPERPEVSQAFPAGFPLQPPGPPAILRPRRPPPRRPSPGRARAGSGSRRALDLRSRHSRSSGEARPVLQVVGEPVEDQAGDDDPRLLEHRLGPLERAEVVGPAPDDHQGGVDGPAQHPAVGQAEHRRASRITRS